MNGTVIGGYAGGRRKLARALAAGVADGDVICLCRGGRVVHVGIRGASRPCPSVIRAAAGKPLASMFHPADRSTVARLAHRGGAAPVGLRLAGGDGGAARVTVEATRVGSLVVVRVAARYAVPGASGVAAAKQASQAQPGASPGETDSDTASRHKVEDDLRLATWIIASTGQAVLVTDGDLKVTDANPAFTRMTGYEASEVIGRLPSFIDGTGSSVVAVDQVRRALASRGRWEGELWARHKSGGERALLVAISAVDDGAGKARRHIATITDITRRKEAETRMQTQANFDVLTGLPNRALFIDLLNRGIASSRRRHERMGLMFIDLDGFKLVNDTMGHDVGDLLLCEAARRLGTCVRADDTVARLGGDEFTVLMPALSDARFAPLVAQRILAVLAEPFVLAGQEAFVSGSIGITVFPDDAEDAIQLLRNADTAMYQAKESGKATYQFFTSELNQAAQERLVLRNRLQRAAENGEFSLHYQPKMDIRTGELTGVEALMRWRNPELGDVSPARFIPVLEETGMVVDIGAWAIRQACRQQREWQEAGLGLLRVAVNLSARQLREPGFPQLVEGILKDVGVRGDDLEIEITESMLMSDVAAVVAGLEKLHDMGIRISMDDFGTGYSSLSYLKRFPIDTIKIDRSFVADIASDAEDVEIIRAIITMGHSLNRRIIAEGVETDEQFRILRDFQCDEMQGYLLSPPLPAESVAAFLRERVPARP